MQYLGEIFFFGTISGIIGTGLGGLIALFVDKVSNRFLCFIMEYAGGLMTAVACFKLFPEAFELGEVRTVFAGIVIGVFAIIFIENIIDKKMKSKKGLIKTGFMVAIGIALHNFPEGFAVGSGFQASTSLGIAITAAIIMHDIPEGLAMAIPMKAGGMQSYKAFIITVLSGLPMGLGTVVGAALGSISKIFVCACLGFAGGAMLYIVYADLIPASKKLYNGRLTSLANIAGILCGMLVSL
mgnify:CR=1 FL=1